MIDVLNVYTRSKIIFGCNEWPVTMQGYWKENPKANCVYVSQDADHSFVVWVTNDLPRLHGWPIGISEVKSGWYVARLPRRKSPVIVILCKVSGHYKNPHTLTAAIKRQARKAGLI